MDIQLYEGIKFYLQNHNTPRNITDDMKKQILNKAHNFIIKQDGLYWITNVLQRKVITELKVQEILYNGHSSVLAGHFDANATYEKLRKYYYWPRMFKTIQDYIKVCDTCQRRGKPKKSQFLHPIPVGEIFDRWGMDIVGPLPPTKEGNKYIMVATEYLTRWPEAQAIPDIKAKTVAKFFYEQIVCRYGSPKVILTDQGSSFNNELVDALCEAVGTRHKLSTAYHPQTNGLTERFNKTLCETIAKYIHQYKEREWDQFVQSALFSYRTKKQVSTYMDPALLMFGRKIKTPMILELQSEQQSEEDELLWDVNQHVEVITTKLEHLRTIAKENITRSQESQKKHYDKKVKEVKYQIGDYVLLYESKDQYKHGDKFRDIYTGPFQIVKAWGNGTYKLRDLESDQISKKIISGARLKKFYPKPNWESIIWIDNTRLQNEGLTKQERREWRRPIRES